MPPPSAAELGSFLPTQCLPSDHLPVVFDLAFLPPSSSSSSGGRSQEAACPKDSLCGSPGTSTVSGPPPGVVRPAALHAVRDAAAVLARGGVVALPTDTLYGLAASARDGAGVARIYEIKGRRAAKPVAVALADARALPRYVAAGHLPPGLVEAVLPGPVTLLLERRADAPLAPGLNPGTKGLGVRIPDSAFVRAVARQLGGALALTSANVSGQTSSVEVGEFQVRGRGGMHGMRWQASVTRCLWTTAGTGDLTPSPHPSAPEPHPTHRPTTPIILAATLAPVSGSVRRRGAGDRQDRLDGGGLDAPRNLLHPQAGSGVGDSS